MELWLMEFEIVGFRKGNDGKDLTVRKKISLREF